MVLLLSLALQPACQLLLQVCHLLLQSGIMLLQASVLLLLLCQLLLQVRHILLLLCITSYDAGQAGPVFSTVLQQLQPHIRGLTRASL